MKNRSSSEQALYIKKLQRHQKKVLFIQIFLLIFFILIWEISSEMGWINSFIFSSSRGGGMNTYQWKSYLPDDAQPFLFQAWSESLTGIELKMNYLNEHDIPINNALIMFDIPGTFSSNQLPKEALSMKHYMFTGHIKFIYNGRLIRILHT